jgi:NAD(P)-dependent dehydrogenase (short-subunit alcohol dehydrogenase family)
VRLAGGRIFVTGASRGIGRAIAAACAAEGAIVGIGWHHAREQAEGLARTIGERAHAVNVDVSDPKSVHDAIEGFTRTAGGLDALVANAGLHVAGLLATAKDEDLKRLVDTNVLGPLVCAREALPHMLANRGGTILFVGSASASRPARGQAAYATTKGSVEALARAICVEYARKGIRAVCLRPGAVDTDMLAATVAMAEAEVTSRIPARRVAKPEEIASIAVSLLASDASYVNGAVIDADGGYGVG